MVVLDVQFMLRACTSQGKMLHDERGHSLDVIQLESGYLEIDRFI
jgi:hypothetical protein